LDNYLPLAIDSSNNEEFSLKDHLICCHLHSKLSNKQQLTTDNEIKEVENSNYLKCEYKNELTCARFYEEKIHSMLEIFSEVIQNFSLHSNLENIKSRKMYLNLLQSVGELV